ncbi:hypothetical protein BLNAU_7854 [Blattamonas nauphoetae]|uniref:Uncharacterized protein n=1 Tax=Blattamonas nauphoetae TaxID=2049346 RepID=A0ABQ9Y0I9_9EUKA|nr:hypothetical protein BLNAU_7854 [Blattamonas nauphoetae]
MLDIISGTIDPVLSPPETQPFFSKARVLLDLYSVDSFFFKDIFVKQAGNTSPETEQNDNNKSDAEPSWSWEGISFEVESLQTILPDSDTSTLRSYTPPSQTSLTSDRISTALTQSSDVTLDLELKPESDAPIDRSRLLHLKLSRLAPRPDPLHQKKHHPLNPKPLHLIHNFSLPTTNQPTVLTNELPEDAFFQADEDVLTALSNAVFTIEQTKSCQCIPLSETLFTHLAHLLDSQHPKIRSLALKLVSHLFSSPSHKSLLLKHTLGAIDTSAAEMSSEVTYFINTSITDQLVTDTPTSESSLLVDNVKSLYTPFWTSEQSEQFEKGMKMTDFMTRELNSQLLKIDTLVSQGNNDFPKLDTGFQPDSPLRQNLQKQVQPIPTIHAIHLYPSFFKHSIFLPLPLSLRLTVFYIFLMSAVAHGTPLPPVLVEYYLEEASPFNEGLVATLVLMALADPHHPFPSKFPIDVLIERLARLHIQGPQSCLTYLMAFLPHSIRIPSLTWIHQFIMRGLHFIHTPGEEVVSCMILFGYADEWLTADERIVYDRLPPRKAITGWLRNGGPTFKDYQYQILRLFTFDEWGELLQFVSRKSFDEQIERFNPVGNISLEMDVFLLTTFALPATFYNPVRQLIAPAIWDANDLDDNPLDRVVIYTHLNIEHPLLILAMCRSFLSKDDLFALFGSEFIVPLLRRSFGSFLPVVNTAALMFVRRVVDLRSVELNLALVSLSVFEMVVRAVEGSSYLEDYMNGTHILSELLRTVAGTINPIASPPETQPFFFNRNHLLKRLLIESTLFERFVVKQDNEPVSEDKPQLVPKAPKKDVPSFRNTVKKATRHVLPVLSRMHAQPSFFKLSPPMSFTPRLRFQTFLTTLHAATVHGIALPQVMIDYYLEEAGNFDELISADVIHLALPEPHNLFFSTFPIDVMIERLARLHMQGRPSSLIHVIYLLRHSTQLFSSRHSTQKFTSTRLHPFLMRDLHVIHIPGEDEIEEPSLFDCVDDVMTDDERFVCECLPPRKAITELLQDGCSNCPISLEMDVFLLTTFALPATFYNPLCQLIAPAIWKACRLDDTPLDIVIDCIDNNSEHPLLILAMCRSFLSKDDLFALLGSEFIVPLLRRSFGSFSPVVNTAALMFVRRVVDLRSVELNVALLSLSVFEMVVRAVEGSSYLEDYMNGTYILSELLETVSGH